MKRLVYISGIVGILMSGCSYRGHDGNREDYDVAIFTGGESREEIIADRTTRNYEPGLDSMPGDNCEPLRVRRLGNLAEVFNDSNYVHWNEGERIGIEPLSDTHSFWTMKRPLVRVESCEEYYLEPLTYSRPYLVPEAATAVKEIGRRFRDSLEARGGGDYRIRVTSVLRTPSTVRRLRRVNRNAIDSSVHQMGTTVDISYANFCADSDSHPRTTEDLKALLAEILYDMREEGKLWVKYEKKQPCFHITARGRGQ